MSIYETITLGHDSQDPAVFQGNSIALRPDFKRVFIRAGETALHFQRGKEPHTYLLENALEPSKKLTFGETPGALHVGATDTPELGFADDTEARRFSVNVIDDEVHITDTSAAGLVIRAAVGDVQTDIREYDEAA